MRNTKSRNYRPLYIRVTKARKPKKHAERERDAPARMCTKKTFKKIQHRLQTKEEKREKNIAGKRRRSRRRFWRNKGFDITLRKKTVPLFKRRWSQAQGAQRPGYKKRSTTKTKRDGKIYNKMRKHESEEEGLQQRRRWRQRQAKQRRQQNRTEATPTWPCLSSVTLSRNQRSRFTASMIHTVGCTLHVSQRPIDGRDELILGRTKSLSTAGEMKIQRHSFVASLARFRILLLSLFIYLLHSMVFFLSARERSRWGSFRKSNG